MDMKKILQAMDGISTKPVEGADSMARFLRVVKEAEINQVPAMPDIAGLQAGQSKDLGNGSNVTVNADGTVSYQGGWGTYIYNAQGQHVKTQSPSMAGYSQETDPTGNVTQQNYSQGPMNIQKGPEGTTANYQLGADNLQTTVQENSLNKFLSIVDKNNVSILSEGANPHRVALPVQMAMQHYQQPATKLQPRERLIDKYFVEAEADLVQQKEEKRAVYNQYAKTIAERVLMKESAQPVTELSTELLSKYKKSAAADAKKADADGDYARGDKRFKGINKATNKQFDNDLKKHGQQAVSEDLDEGLQRLYDLKDQIEEAIKQRLDPKCWTGKHKEGTKIKGGVRVNNCVPNKK